MWLSAKEAAVGRVGGGRGAPSEDYSMQCEHLGGGAEPLGGA